MYEETKDCLTNMALESINCILDSNKSTQTKYHKIRYIVEATEDVLKIIYDLTIGENK